MKSFGLIQNRDFDERFFKPAAKSKDPAFRDSLKVANSFGINFNPNNMQEKERVIMAMIEGSINFAKANGFEMFVYDFILNQLTKANKDNQIVLLAVQKLLSILKQLTSDTHSVNVNKSIDSILSVEMASHWAFGFINLPLMHRKAFDMFQKNYLKKLCSNQIEVDYLRKDNHGDTTVKKIDDKFLVFVNPYYRIWACQSYKPIDYASMIVKYKKSI